VLEETVNLTKTHKMFKMQPSTLKKKGGGGEEERILQIASSNNANDS
jgi:hypothetical protein